MPAGKLVVDTNVYIMAIRQGHQGPAAARLSEWFPRTYLAAVVSAELRAGVRSDHGLEQVHTFSAGFARVGRVVAPTARSWDVAGDVLALIARARPDLSESVRDLWNDALIAMSARQIGATVITDNIADFALLLEYVDFGLEPFAARSDIRPSIVPVPSRRRRARGHRANANPLGHLS
jgi:predicted nucleic acid-binding protein